MADDDDDRFMKQLVRDAQEAEREAKVILALMVVIVAVAVALLSAACAPSFGAAGAAAVDAGGAAGAAAVDAGGAGGAGDGAPLVACHVAAWDVQAFASAPDEPPALMLDGDPLTRWASGAPRAAGQWLEFQPTRGLRVVELVGSAGNTPGAVRVLCDGVELPALVVVSGARLVVSADLECAKLRLELVDASEFWLCVSELAADCAP
ncbi:MAG TPA: hypothetical protein VGC79_31400 [Polyangiaceae bacterium]